MQYIFNLRKGKTQYFSMYHSIFSLKRINVLSETIRTEINAILGIPCQSVPVRCNPVASLGNEFGEITSPVPNYSSPANK